MPLPLSKPCIKCGKLVGYNFFMEAFFCLACGHSENYSRTPDMFRVVSPRNEEPPIQQATPEVPRNVTTVTRKKSSSPGIQKEQPAAAAEPDTSAFSNALRRKAGLKPND